MSSLGRVYSFRGSLNKSKNLEPGNIELSLYKATYAIKSMSKWDALQSVTVLTNEPFHFNGRTITYPEKPVFYASGDIQ